MELYQITIKMKAFQLTLRIEFGVNHLERSAPLDGRWSLSEGIAFSIDSVVNSSDDRLLSHKNSKNSKNMTLRRSIENKSIIGIKYIVSYIHFLTEHSYFSNKSRIRTNMLFDHIMKRVETIRAT